MSTGSSDGSRRICWFCYVLECADGTFYTGITTSIDRRLAMHQRGRASRYTRGRRPVRLVYAAPCEDRSAASRREVEVKKMSRAQKRRLGTANDGLTRSSHESPWIPPEPRRLAPSQDGAG